MGKSAYITSVVKMIRNNNVPIGETGMKDCDVYFMLDYFDLLYHQELKEENNSKIYKKFWNINDDSGKENFSYRVARKTLSLYADASSEKTIFRKKNTETELSDTPFLGIIQINFVHHKYKYMQDKVEDMLILCEKKIMECVQSNVSANMKLDCKIYRSSTSGDFCLVIRCAVVSLIYKIATLINNLVIQYVEEYIQLSTYTNVGIECIKAKSGDYLPLQKVIIEENSDCVFAIRFTVGNEFAQILNKKMKAQRAGNKETDRLKTQYMAGLFGRYDFLIYMSMADFADIYATLCKSKIDGFKGEEILSVPPDASLTEIIKVGITQGKIEIINERALIPVEAGTFQLQTGNGTALRGGEIDNILLEYEKEKEREISGICDKFAVGMRDFKALESVFIEERRPFIDLERELQELISTYVPQGIQHDSYVNWQILIADLQVTFECINEWQENYSNVSDEEAKRELREHFLNDLRLLIDAISQFYKFIQNVNAQTWQAPLYEIQTQLDAEKLMVAYREFMYDYFTNYKQHENNKSGKRHMLFPIVYPDITIDNACVMVVFPNQKNVDSRLLICRVPSFEYYGRMFDMIPWILHEASHSIRTMGRCERNRYLMRFVFKSIFSQVMYKLLNQYSNDFGYYRLGLFENDIAVIMAEAAMRRFIKYCKEKGLELFCMDINHMETEMTDFLFLIFDRSAKKLEKQESEKSIKKIQSSLLCLLGELNLLNYLVCVDDDKKKVYMNISEAVEKVADRADIFLSILELVYNAYYENMTGEKAKENEWFMLQKDSILFEEDLNTILSTLQTEGISDDWRRDYAFKMRELNRLAGAWAVKKANSKSDLLRKDICQYCLSEIRTRTTDGFEKGEGFVEIYRILNVLFGYGDNVEDEDFIRIGNSINVLLQEEVNDLIIREISIYRETYADLYMTATLGLSSFGYCRQMFQTVSDAGIEERQDWTESINIHRFRSVIAVLLDMEGYERNEDSGTCRGNKIIFPVKSLLNQGQKYCLELLNYAKNITNKSIENSVDKREKEKAINDLFNIMNENVFIIFNQLSEGSEVEKSLEDSVLAMYLDIHTRKHEVDSPFADEREQWRKCLEYVRLELNESQHIIYRIKCFIRLLNLIIDNGYIIVDLEDHKHYKELYCAQQKEASAIRETEVCKEVSGFYNEPETVNSKFYGEMLDDTLQFIQTYYYKNRFEIMHFIYESGEQSDGTKSTT